MLYKIFNNNICILNFTLVTKLKKNVFPSRSRYDFRKVFFMVEILHIVEYRQRPQMEFQVVNLSFTHFYIVFYAAW